MADDVQTYLAANVASLTAGRNLFVGSFPANKVDIVTLYDTGGGPANQDYATDTFTVQVDLRYRATSYEPAMAMAATIFKLLNRKQNLSIGAKNVMMVSAITKPQVVGRDDKGRWHITINLSFHVRDYYGEE